jgi:hypothetical protein
VVEVSIGSVFGLIAFDADACAVGSAEIDGCADQLMEDGIGIFDEGEGKAAHAFHLKSDVAGVQAPSCERGVAVEVENLQASICWV